MVAQLYPQALRSLFFASYDSEGYGGGIRTQLHTGWLTAHELRVLLWPGADREQTTHLNRSSVVIRVSVAMVMRVYQTVFRQLSTPRMLMEALPNRWSFYGFQASCHLPRLECLPRSEKRFHFWTHVRSASFTYISNALPKRKGGYNMQMITYYTFQNETWTHDGRAVAKKKVIKWFFPCGQASKTVCSFGSSPKIRQHKFR
jgi:hypothetical protein